MSDSNRYMNLFRLLSSMTVRHSTKVISKFEGDKIVYMTDEEIENYYQERRRRAVVELKDLFEESLSKRNLKAEELLGFFVGVPRPAMILFKADSGIVGVDFDILWKEVFPSTLK